MSEARLASWLDGPDGVSSAAYCGISVIRGTSHLAPYQTPGPVSAAILAHLGCP